MQITGGIASTTHVDYHRQRIDPALLEQFAQLAQRLQRGRPEWLDAKAGLAQYLVLLGRQPGAPLLRRQLDARCRNRGDSD